jgi:hypothetical protein
MGGIHSKKSKFKLKMEKIFKSLNESANIKYDGYVVRNTLLEKGIKIFTIEEREKFMKYDEETGQCINEFINHQCCLHDDVRELYIDFLIACHYGYKEMAEYLLQNYQINTFMVHETFVHCIYMENIDICDWLFSLKNVDYKQLYGFIHESYYDLFKKCCIYGELISAKWLYARGEINFSNELMGVFLENISTNGHKYMLSWLIDEVKCTKNENLINKFRPVE